MSGIGNIVDLQTNGYAEKIAIFDPVSGLPVDWANLGTGVTTPTRSRNKAHFLSPVFGPGNSIKLAFELCPNPGQLKSIKITNSFYVDLFAQIMNAPDVDTFLTWTGHAERFLVGSMQTVVLDGEDLFSTLTEIAGQKLYIRFSTELYDYVPLVGEFPSSQRVSGTAVTLFG